MNYQQVKAAWFEESFDLVQATQKQISKLEAEFIRTGNEHGADWLQSRYEDMQYEMDCIREDCRVEFG